MIEIELIVDGSEVRVSAFGSRGERPGPHSLGPETTPETLELFTKKVGGAVRKGTPLDSALVVEAQKLHKAVFQGELEKVVTAQTSGSPPGRPLVRLVLRDPRLQKVPWEALCRPGTTEEFLAGGGTLLAARGVSSPEPCEPREVKGAIRLLAIAPGGDAGVPNLKDALEAPIQGGEIDWLEPITGERATVGRLFEQLRSGPRPHVLHFLGHGGVDSDGHPALRLADDEDGDEVWIKAEALAQELKASVGEELRLVVLEACEGARPGLLGSAAEIVARSGAVAVVAYLWPVPAAQARTCSLSFYRALTTAQSTRGDVAASLSAARRTLLAESASGFSPVLYLRGTDPVLFHFIGSAPATKEAAPPPPKPSPFVVPFLRDPRFIGREGELKELSAALSAAEPGITAGICGMGGVGKTWLAVELAFRCQNSFPGGIYWVNAAKSWQDELAALAEKIGLHIECTADTDRPKQLAAAFTSYLAEHPGALMIVDNVKDALELRDSDRDIVPARLPCRIVFTTRRQEPAFSTVELGGLPEPDALKLLLSTPGRRHVLEGGAEAELRTATDICRTLGHLPLAIALASAYLDKHPRIALSGYLSGLVQQGALLVTDVAEGDRRRLPAQPEKALRATLEEQWSALRPDSEAPRVLKTAALLGPAVQVPRARLSLLTGLSDEPLEWRAAPLEEALQELAELCFVERLTEREILLHRLVQEFAVEQIKARAEVAAAAAALLVDALWDLERLQREAAARGIDAIIEDLRVASKLAGPSAQGRIEALLRPLDRESHCLRSWAPASAPGYLLQQLRNRCLDLGIHDVRERAQATLRARAWPCLLERIPTSRESEALLRTFEGHTLHVADVAVSSDGVTAVSASWDTTLKVWDLETGQATNTLQGHAAWVSSVDISPDGRFALSGSMDATLKLWDLKTGQLVRTLQGHTDVVCRVAITPDGRRAVSVSMDKTFRLWDLETGQLVRTFEGNASPMVGLALSADGRRAVIGADDGTLKVWDLETGQAVRTIEAHAVRVSGVAVTPDGRFAISAPWDAALKVWDLETGEAARTLAGHSGFVISVEVTPDGRFAVSASTDRTLRVWDIATGQCVRILQGHSADVLGVAITQDGRQVVSSSVDTTLKLWDLGTEQIPRSQRGPTAGLNGVAVTEDGRLAASASADTTVKLWDLATGQVIRALQGHVGAVNAVEVTRDGRLAVSASDDETLRVWDLATGQAIHVLKGHSSYVRGLGLTPDGRFAISAAWDNTLRVWDLATGAAVRALEGHTHSVNSVAVTSDGRLAVSASVDATLRVWSLETGALVRTLQGHTSSVRCAVISPDGRVAMSASSDDTVRIWDLEAGQLVHTIQEPAGGVLAGALSRDGRFAVTVSADRTLKVWQIPTAKLIATVETHAVLRSCAVAPDGKTIVAGDEAGALHILDFCHPPT